MTELEIIAMEIRKEKGIALLVQGEITGTQALLMAVAPSPLLLEASLAVAETRLAKRGERGQHRPRAEKAVRPRTFDELMASYAA